MIPASFPPKEEIARLTARAFLEIGAVHFNAREPFTLASGLPSPTYIDCRKLISYPRIRSTLMDFLAVTVMREAGFEAFDNIAGGMGTAAFVALLMALCDHRFTATQYALLSALAAFGRVYVGPAAGYMTDPKFMGLDWVTFFFVTFLVALPGLALLWWKRTSIRALDGGSGPGSSPPERRPG